MKSSIAKIMAGIMIAAALHRPYDNKGFAMGLPSWLSLKLGMGVLLQATLVYVGAEGLAFFASTDSNALVNW
jgi:hypothetical protein